MSRQSFPGYQPPSLFIHGHKTVGRYQRLVKDVDYWRVRQDLEFARDIRDTCLIDFEAFAKAVGSVLNSSDFPVRAKMLFHSQQIPKDGTRNLDICNTTSRIYSGSNSRRHITALCVSTERMAALRSLRYLKIVQYVQIETQE